MYRHRKAQTNKLIMQIKTFQMLSRRIYVISFAVTYNQEISSSFSSDDVVMLLDVT
jgi:hypothetical protein